MRTGQSVFFTSLTRPVLYRVQLPDPKGPGSFLFSIFK